MASLLRTLSRTILRSPGVRRADRASAGSRPRAVPGLARTDETRSRVHIGQRVRAALVTAVRRRHVEVRRVAGVRRSIGTHRAPAADGVVVGRGRRLIPRLEGTGCSVFGTDAFPIRRGGPGGRGRIRDEHTVEIGVLAGVGGQSGLQLLGMTACGCVHLEGDRLSLLEERRGARCTETGGGGCGSLDTRQGQKAHRREQQGRLQERHE
jgi:hypothetical protein